MKKDTVIIFRITASNKAFLKDQAEKNGMSLTAFIESLFNSKVNTNFA